MFDNISNEVIAILIMFFFMGCAVAFYKMGRVWLQSFLIISYIITLCITPKFFDFFGLTTTAGVITYAGLFLATDMMTERYGKQAGFQTVRIGFVISLVFVAMTQANLLFTPLPFVQEVSDGMNAVFGSSVRIMISSFLVYLFVQHFDVWLYHKLHELMKGKHLWLRNNGSTVTSQFVDTVLFCALAFYGTMPNDQLLEILIVAFGLKVLIALFDTPFIYLAKRIKPLDIE